MSARMQMKKGFTLVEILIVVVILGILAAIVIPQFTSASETAKASSLVSQLQTIRSQIELYQVQHNGTYPDFATEGWDQLTGTTDASGDTDGTDYGPYLQQAPKNPFTADSDDATTVGTAAAADVAWIWDATNKTFKASLSDALNAEDDLKLSTSDFVEFAN